MLGASSRRRDRMRTWPRLVGFRLQTLAVKALKRCSGSPKASSDSGCTWYSRFGMRALRVAAREGAELRRRHAHRPAAAEPRTPAPMSALPHHDAAIVFSVFTPSTPKTARICRWSCRLSPTPGSSWTGAMPCSLQQGARADARELQDLRRADRAGREQHLAAARQRACTRRAAAGRQHLDAAARASRAPSPRCSSSSASTCAPVQTCRLARRCDRAQEGLRGVPAHAARWLTSK